MKSINTLMSLSLLFILGSCQNPSQTHYSEREIHFPEPIIPQYESPQTLTADWEIMDLPSEDLGFNPKVDFLFVLDISKSMNQTQKKLKDNISKLIAPFTKHRHIDYHVGVTTNWDHDTEAFISKFHEGPGALLPIKGLEERFLKKSAHSDKFIISNLSQLLTRGALSLEEGGPEFESFFTPIRGALEKTQKGDPNEGFIREDAHLVIFIITDADDTSPESAESLVQFLTEFKKDRKKVSAYGILVDKNDKNEFKDHGLKKDPKNHPECFDEIEAKPTKNNKNPKKEWKDNGSCPSGFGPEKIENFIVRVNSYLGSRSLIMSKHIYSLPHADYGSALDKIAQNVSAQISTKEIRLDKRPQLSSGNEKKEIQIRVEYGTDENYEIVDKRFWTYDNFLNKIKILGPWKENINPQGQFRVHILPKVYDVQVKELNSN